jgi:hypothetical protein
LRRAHPACAGMTLSQCDRRAHLKAERSGILVYIAE